MSKVFEVNRSASHPLTQFNLSLLVALSVVVGIFLLLVLVSYHPSDPNPYNLYSTGEVNNIFGNLGAWVAGLLKEHFGYFSYWFPIYILFFNSANKSVLVKITYFFLLPISSCIFAGLVLYVDVFTLQRLFGSLAVTTWQSDIAWHWRIPIIIVYLYIFYVITKQIRIKITYSALLIQIKILSSTFFGRLSKYLNGLTFHRDFVRIVKSYFDVNRKDKAQDTGHLVPKHLPKYTKDKEKIASIFRDNLPNDIMEVLEEKEIDVEVKQLKKIFNKYSSKSFE